MAKTVFRRQALCCAVSLSLLTSISIQGAEAQGVQANALAQASQRNQLIDRLDSLTRDALSRIPVASVSVIVIHRQDTLIRRAYGQAELNFGVPATPATLYRLIGAGQTLLATAVLRAAEQGRLALKDDASKYLPEFPWRRILPRGRLNFLSLSPRQVRLQNTAGRLPPSGNAAPAMHDLASVISLIEDEGTGRQRRKAELKPGQRTRLGFDASNFVNRYKNSWPS